MEKYRVQSGVRPEVIYVIFRVYDLFSTDIKYEIFVDPWHLRSNTLQFTTDRWKVTGPMAGF